MRPSAPPPDPAGKSKTPPPPDITDVPDKFHAGKLCVVVMKWEARCEHLC